jgi:RNA polymerase primary sigma factor
MRDVKVTPSLTDRTDAVMNRYLKELSSCHLIDAKEEVRLAEKIKAGDKAAEQRLILANLRFVVSCAKKYQHMGLSLNDLIPEGNIGLIKAVSLFDPTRGFKFISYAVWWIRQCMVMALGENTRIVRVPMNQQLGHRNLKAEAIRLEQHLEREPTLTELAEVLDKSESQLADFIGCNMRSKYLEDVIPGLSETNTLLECLPDNYSNDLTADWILKDDLQHQISRLLSGLLLREQTVLKLHFGIGCSPLSEEALAIEMKLSKERIRQIKVIALKKLKARVQAG